MAVTRPFALVLLAALAAAPAAQARRLVLGSSLRAPATRVETHGADTAFWPRAIRGRSFRAPARGQVLAVRLKGGVLRSSRAGAPDPLDEVHFQSLRPAGGAMTVALTSGAFHVPVGGPRDRITTYRPVNLCVVRGGVVAFNDEGGFSPPWYDHGAPFRVFGRVPGSATLRFTSKGGTNNGDVLHPPQVRGGSELLMQVVLGTGRNVSTACRNWRP